MDVSVTEKARSSDKSAMSKVAKKAVETDGAKEETSSRIVKFKLYVDM